MYQVKLSHVPDGPYKLYKLNDTMDYVVIGPNGEEVLRSIACDYCTMKMMALNRAHDE